MHVCLSFAILHAMVFVCFLLYFGSTLCARCHHVIIATLFLVIITISVRMALCSFFLEQHEDHLVSFSLSLSIFFCFLPMHTHTHTDVNDYYYTLVHLMNVRSRFMCFLVSCCRFCRAAILIILAHMCFVGSGVCAASKHCYHLSNYMTMIFTCKDK